jgi:hypothetical protein
VSLENYYDLRMLPFCLWILLVVVLTVRTLSGYESTNVSEMLMMGMQWVRKYHWSMRDLILSIFRRYTNMC